MLTFLLAVLAYVSALVSSRHRLALEAVALRQQLAVYKRKQPRPKLRPSDRLFWVVLRRVCKNWSEALILVKQVRWFPGIAPIPLVLEMAIPLAGWEGRRWRKKFDT